MTRSNERTAQAALSGIFILQMVMLGALFTRTVPHPPVTIPLSGMGPFLGAALAVAGAAIIVGPTHSLWGKVLAVLAVICALVSFGPQKFLDPQFASVWPAVVTGQLFAAIVFVTILKCGKGTPVLPAQ